jgi:hypothetical protein
MPSVLPPVSFKLTHILFSVPAVFPAVSEILSAIPEIFPAVTAIFGAVKTATRMPSFISIQFAIIVAIKAFQIVFSKSRFFIGIDGAVTIGVDALPQGHTRSQIGTLFFSQYGIGIRCQCQTQCHPGECC